MEASTIIPTAIARPPNEMVLMDKPNKFMNTKEEISDTGIEIKIIRVFLIFPKNKKITNAANKPPSKALFNTLRMDLRIKSASSLILLKVRCGYKRLMRPISYSTSSLNDTALPSFFLRMDTPRIRFPFSVKTDRSR